jgi:hypothetical protein
MSTSERHGTQSAAWTIRRAGGVRGGILHLLHAAGGLLAFHGAGDTYADATGDSVVGGVLGVVELEGTATVLVALEFLCDSKSVSSLIKR